MSALFMSLLGTKWSGVTTTLFGLKTVSLFAFSSISIAGVVVTSWHMTMSIFAFINSPGCTSFLLQCFASIFSVIVIDIFILWILQLRLFLRFLLHRTASSAQ